MTEKNPIGGMFGNVALLDIASMHPSSIEAMDLFGPYTKRFSAIKQARIAIKHRDIDKAVAIFREFMDEDKVRKLEADLRGENSKAVAGALKIAINSVYGLTSAKFPNRFNDVAAGVNDRNKDNKVAKRGALFMIKLKHEVQRRGYTVVHIKTDSIKIADADQSIIDFVTDMGKRYGYDFEHEATYDKLCIINKSTYAAHCVFGEEAGEWTSTGAQLIQPYVFKTLFSHEPIRFEDMCETKSVANATLFLDFNEGLAEGEHNYSFVGRVGGFCPIKPGMGGGELLRTADNVKYSYATGAKGWRWKESSIVRDNDLIDQIDRGYYDLLCEKAIDAINEFGDFEWFASDEPYISPNPESNKLPRDV